MSRDDYLFVERQTLHPIVVVAAIALGVGGLALLVPIPDADPAISADRGVPGMVMLAVSAFLLNILPMMTWVDRTEIRVQFGSLLPIYVKRIPIARIASARSVEYRPIRQAGGWGIRWGRFEGKPTRYLNARGSRGVLVEGEKLRFIIGSTFPEKFAEAVDAAREGLAAEHKKHGTPKRPGIR